MKLSQLKQIVKEETQKMLSEASQWPMGHFEVVNSFEITPGGGWSVVFKKGDILRIEDASRIKYPGPPAYQSPGVQRIQKWDALQGDWVKVAPPISGMEVFPIDKFGGSQGWVQKFTQNTKMLSKGAAESKIKTQEASSVVTAAEGIKMLKGLSPTTQVKITVIK